MRRLIQLYLGSFGGLSREIWLLFWITLINRSGTMILPFLTVYLTKNLDFSLSEAGLVMTFFGIGSLVGAYIGGYLTDRFGYYPVIFGSLLGASGMFLLLVQQETVAEFCLYIFLTSTIADIFRPANYAAIDAYSKEENKTRSLTLIRLAINLGFAIGPAAGGLLAGTVGWRALFYADAITCFGAAIAFILLLKNVERKQKQQARLDGVKASYMEVLSDKFYLQYLFFLLVSGIAFFQVFSTVPVFYSEVLGFPETWIGGLMALNGGLIALIEMPLIAVVEKRFSKMSLVAFGTIFFAGAYFCLIAGAWLGLIACLGFTILLTVGEMINFPFSNSFALARSTPANRGRYMGLFTITFSISLIIAPALGTYLGDLIGYRGLWMVCGGLGLISFVGLRYLQKIAEKPSLGLG